MKIELDVNSGDLAKSVNEIMSNLTPEQKLELAKQTMEKWLREPYDFERVARERDVIEGIRAKDTYGRKETEPQIRGGYEFSNSMRDWKSTKETMVSTITREIMEAYKAEVKKVVESDPKIAAMKDEVVAIIKSKFPQAVHDAMVTWMAESMQAMFETTMGIRQNAAVNEKYQSELQTRLMQVEAVVQGRMS